MSDTIASIATGTGISAIGIIRLSGDGAIEIADRVFSPDSGRTLASCPDRLLVHGKLHDENKNVLDICLATISRAPHSYTGENCAELQCHGSPLVLRCALSALFAAGARQALPGEYTKRAFLNGRLDLTQAEAVIDLIEAETEEAARNAAGQLGGAVSRKISAIYDTVLNMASHFYAVLDYPDEDIDPFELKNYISMLENAGEELARLERGFDRGRIMTAGVKTVILGRPNVGKSSLLNSLLGFERAIVTPIPGTTRDTVEGSLKFGGVLLRLADTAGLRASQNPVERLGIERAEEEAKRAELAIVVFDGSEPLSKEDGLAVAASKSAKHRLAVINKSDLPQRLSAAEIEGDFDASCAVSALKGSGISELEDAVRALFPPAAAPPGEILTNVRQAEAVSRARESIKSALFALAEGLTPDIVLTEAEQAVSALGELTGRSLREDVTARIFERFCVGK